VNFPDSQLDYQNGYRIAITNENIPNMVGQISTILASKKINIVDMINRSKDKLAYTLLDVNQPLAEENIQVLRAIEGVLQVRMMPSAH